MVSRIFHPSRFPLRLIEMEVCLYLSAAVSKTDRERQSRKGESNGISWRGSFRESEAFLVVVALELMSVLSVCDASRTQIHCKIYNFFSLSFTDALSNNV